MLLLLSFIQASMTFDNKKKEDKYLKNCNQHLTSVLCQLIFFVVSLA